MMLPTKEVLLECTEFATTAEAAAYLAASVEAIFKKERVLDEFRSLSRMFYTHASALDDEENRQDQIWDGIPPVSAYQAQIEAEAPQVSNTVEEKQVMMDIVVHEDQKLDRGYLVDSHEPDPAQTERLDHIFWGWLASQGWRAKDQLVYEATASGEFKLDAHGNMIQVDVETFKSRLLAVSPGLRQYAKSHFLVNMESIRVIPGSESIERGAAEQAGPD